MLFRSVHRLHELELAAFGGEGEVVAGDVGDGGLGHVLAVHADGGAFVNGREEGAGIAGAGVFLATGLRLVIKGVELRGTALHAEKNNTAGAGGEARRGGRAGYRFPTRFSSSSASTSYAAAPALYLS